MAWFNYDTGNWEEGDGNFMPTVAEQANSTMAQGTGGNVATTGPKKYKFNIGGTVKDLTFQDFLNQAGTGGGKWNTQGFVGDPLTSTSFDTEGGNTPTIFQNKGGLKIGGYQWNGSQFNPYEGEVSPEDTSFMAKYGIMIPLLAAGGLGALGGTTGGLLGSAGTSAADALISAGGAEALGGGGIGALTSGSAGLSAADALAAAGGAEAGVSGALAGTGGLSAADLAALSAVDSGALGGGLTAAESAAAGLGGGTGAGSSFIESLLAETPTAAPAGSLGTSEIGLYPGSGLENLTNIPTSPLTQSGGSNAVTEVAAQGVTPTGSPVQTPVTGGGGSGMDWLDELLNNPEFTTGPQGPDVPGVLDSGVGGGVGSGGSALDAFDQTDVLGGGGGSLPTSTLPSWLTSMPSSPFKTLLSGLFGGSGGTGTGTGSGWGNLLGTGIGGILDYKAATDRTNALKEIADRSWGAGQASRDRYNAAQQPGFNIVSIPGLQSGMDTVMDTYLRKLSATGGNPAGIGAAPSQTQAYVLGNVGLPAYQNYVNSNASAGGLASLAANSTAAATQAAADPGVYGSFGRTVDGFFNGPKEDPYKQIRSLFGLPG